MKLRWIDSEDVNERDLSELPALRERTDGFLWLDIPEWSDEAEALFANEFHFHPMAISESRNRNHVPRVHVYPHHEFIVLHAPEIGTGGHVHYLELDQFVGENFLVTVHGPLNPKVPLEAALRETNAVAARMDSGRLHPTSPFGLTSVVLPSRLSRRDGRLRVARSGWTKRGLPPLGRTPHSIRGRRWVGGAGLCGPSHRRRPGRRTRPRSAQPPPASAAALDVIISPKPPASVLGVPPPDILLIMSGLVILTGDHRHHHSRSSRTQATGIKMLI